MENQSEQTFRGGGGLVGSLERGVSAVKSNETPLSRELNRQDAQIEELHKVISELREKLQPILMPENPSKEKNETSEPHESDLVRYVNDKTFKIELANEKLSDIIERITL